MEVHQHSHSSDPDSHRGRKKWTHYFWEFFMLFLAVFCGFLAENQREHYIERQRAKVYARNLLHDLQADTADINRAIRWGITTSSMIDSLVAFTTGPDIYKQSKKLYYLMRRAGSFYGVDWSKATMDQLINSGNLRYFNNHELVRLISSYNTMSAGINEQEDGVMAHRNRATVFRDQIFKAEYFLRSIREFNQDSINTEEALPVTNLLQSEDWPVMSKDPGLINSYANALISTKPFRQRLDALYYPDAIAEATKIMELLRKEYHLD